MASDRFFLPWRSLRNDQVTERYTQTHLLTNTEIRCTCIYIGCGSSYRFVKASS